MSDKPIDGPPIVKFYCISCEEAREVIIEDLSTDDLNGDSIWGDIICSECHLVIATVTSNSPGQYAFIKVGEIGANHLEVEP